MRRTSLHTILVFGAVALMQARPVGGQNCANPEGLCTEPCPSEGSCQSDEDCTGRLECRPACVPSYCWCEVDRWNCEIDCSWKCARPPAHADPPRYMIIDLGTLDGWTSTALGINELGQVVGEADSPSGVRHAFLRDNSVMTDLYPEAGAGWTTAPDLNNFGQVLVNWGQSALLWDNGEIIPLGGLDPNGRYATAYAINDAGQVVGSSSGAFLWEDGVMTELGDTVGLWHAEDINNFGDIAGIVLSELDFSHAALWDGHTLTDLGTLGGERSRATGINDLGQVIGRSERAPGGDRVFHAFLWDGGEMIDLGAIGGFRWSRASAINKCGQVIGSPQFLYDPDEGMLDLEYLLPPDHGWFTLVPWDINDAGQIVGYGTFTGLPRAFLMTPIDADFDDNDDTDLVDFAAFRACMTGPGTRVEDGCKKRDIDRDGDADLNDFRALQWVFSGP